MLNELFVHGQRLPNCMRLHLLLSQGKRATNQLLQYYEEIQQISCLQPYLQALLQLSWEYMYFFSCFSVLILEK